LTTMGTHKAKPLCPQKPPKNKWIKKLGPQRVVIIQKKTANKLNQRETHLGNSQKTERKIIGGGGKKTHKRTPLKKHVISQVPSDKWSEIVFGEKKERDHGLAKHSQKKKQNPRVDWGGGGT